MWADFLSNEISFCDDTSNMLFFFFKKKILLKCACAREMLSSGNHVKLYLLNVLVLWLFPDIFRRQKVVESIGLYFSHFKFLRVFP